MKGAQKEVRPGLPRARAATLNMQKKSRRQRGEECKARANSRIVLMRAERWKASGQEMVKKEVKEGVKYLKKGE